VPNFGAATARLLVVGLAPGAHGANRTGRAFTGDGGGNFLIRAMHETGFANRSTSTHAEDGLRLIDAAIANVARCAPPGNKPTPREVAACGPFLDETFDLMRRLRVVVALGRIAFDRCLHVYAKRGWLSARQKPKFSHGCEFSPADGPVLIASFHPSQQNTFTGRLTPEMLRQVFDRARAAIPSDRRGAARGAGVTAISPCGSGRYISADAGRIIEPPVSRIPSSEKEIRAWPPRSNTRTSSSSRPFRRT
jgi:uracil-DNA glycosylase